MFPLVCRMGLIGIALGLTGCAGFPGPDGFEPAPAEVVWADGDVRALVTAEGRQTRDAGPLIHVRMRLANETDEPVTLVVQKMELVAGDLSTLGPPTPDASLTVNPGERRIVPVQFSVPAPAARKLSGMHLSIPLEIDGKIHRQGVRFERREPRDQGWRHHHFYHGYHVRPHGSHIGIHATW
ncbi:MAG: hypothetical protein R3336_05865 [Phycisphaeraceae bacterium]|nr:hypothetical protein [Phycisphaeraceae bacterium]